MLPPALAVAVEIGIQQVVTLLLRQVRYENQDPADALVTNLAQEREVNTFFRLDSPSVIARLQAQFPEIGDNPDPKSVFLKLRELRNTW